MEQYVGLDVSLKETSLCVYQTGTTLAVADTILWPAARGSGVMQNASWSRPGPGFAWPR